MDLPKPVYSFDNSDFVNFIKEKTLDKPDFEDNEKPNPIPLENIHKAYIDCLFVPIYKQLDEIKTELLKAINNE